jgi:TetR/AcrR family transcriptional regulator, mexCD-oprJ operon repressor
VLAATWRKLGRYHALVAINTSTQTPEELRRRHDPFLGRLLPLIERGQAEGVFRTDVSPGWHLSMLMALVHAGSAEMRAGRVSENKAEAALVATVLGAVATCTAAERG